jgi:hypothetical protein
MDRSVEMRFEELRPFYRRVNQEATIGDHKGKIVTTSFDFSMEGPCKIEIKLQTPDGLVAFTGTVDHSELKRIIEEYGL